MDKLLASHSTVLIFRLPYTMYVYGYAAQMVGKSINVVFTSGGSRCRVLLALGTLIKETMCHISSPTSRVTMVFSCKNNQHDETLYTLGDGFRQGLDF